MTFDSIFLAQAVVPATTTPAPAEGDTTTSTTTPAPGTPGTPGGAPAGPPPSLLQHPLFGLTLVIVVFYVVLFWGRSRRQRQFDQKLQGIKKNDRIVTIGGIVGTVVSTTDERVVVKVDESTNTKMTFVRKAIQTVTPPE